MQQRQTVVDGTGTTDLVYDIAPLQQPGVHGVGQQVYYAEGGGFYRTDFQGQPIASGSGSTIQSTSWFTYIICCGWLCPASKEEDDPAVHDRAVGMPWGSGRQKTPQKDGNQVVIGEDFRHVGGISRDVYDKIKEVDNQTSTLTAHGPDGLSGRVVEKLEYQQQNPDGTPEWFIVEVIELIKRPGQTLGLYIREGNDDDRPKGIFVSRIQESTEMERIGLLKVGYEILSVNNVDVGPIPVEDVVVIMSIPRRLLLKVRYPKYHRIIGPMGESDNQKQKPIVILKHQAMKQLARTNSIESGLDEEIESRTDQTSLGARARGVLLTTSSVNEKTPLIQQKTVGPSHVSRSMTADVPRCSSMEVPSSRHSGSAMHPSLSAQQHLPFNRHGVAAANTPNAHGFRRNVAFHSPRVLDAQGRPMMDDGVEMGHPEWQPNMEASLDHRINSAYPTFNAAGTALPIGPHFPDNLNMNEFASDSQPRMPLAARQPGYPNRMGYGSPYMQRSHAVPGQVKRTESLQMDNHRTNLPYSIQMSDQAAQLGIQLSPRSVTSDSEAFRPSPRQTLYSLPFHHHQVNRAATYRSPQLDRASTSLYYPSVPHSVVPSGYDSDSGLLNYTTAYGASLESQAHRALGGSSQGPLYGGVHVPSTGFAGAAPPISVPYSMSIGAPTTSAIKPVLRPFSGPPLSHGGIYPTPSYLPQEMVENSRSKANSLPRRRLGGRQVKWKNDVVNGRNGVFSSVPHNILRSEYTSDSDGAVSAPELPVSPHFATMRPNLPHRIRTVDDIFTSEEYRAWMGQPDFATSPLFEHERRSREYLRARKLNQQMATQPSRYMHHNSADMINQPLSYHSMQDPHQQSLYGTSQRRSNSVPPRRIGLQHSVPIDIASGSIQQPGQPDELHPLSGMLRLDILEGRGLRVPERRGDSNDEMYCVVEVDSEHRARTSVSTYEQRYAWNEAFDIEILTSRQLDFFIYSWHARYRHRLCHRGSLKLLRGMLGDGQEKKFALTLEPRGQLIVKVVYRNLNATFCRNIALRLNAYFGVAVQSLVERERTGIEVPVGLKRLVEEIERRGLDCLSLYLLCGSSYKKQHLKNELEKSPNTAPLVADMIPDVSVITGVLKDFLRELPEAIFTPGIYQMLLEAWDVCLPNDTPGNVKLMLGIVDCLPVVNKCTVMIVMDHIKVVLAHSSQNSLTVASLAGVFGPLLFCTAKATADDNGGRRKNLNTLDPHLAIRILTFLLELWPSKNSSSESSGSDNSTISLTHNGTRSLVTLWMQENGLRESSC